MTHEEIEKKLEALLVRIRISECAGNFEEVRIYQTEFLGLVRIRNMMIHLECAA